MILHDFMCLQCEFIDEYLVDRDCETLVCPKCGHIMKKTFIRGGGHRQPDETGWLRTVLEVVDKNPGPDKPCTKEFLRNPTRENYKAWMRENKIRPLEDGERPHRETEKEAKQRRHYLAGQLTRNLMDRKAISVRTR